MWLEAFLTLLFLFTQTPGRPQKASRREVVRPVRARPGRKRAVPEGGEDEASYRHLVEFSPDGIVIHRGGKLVFVNPAAEQLFGAKAPELIGTAVIDRVHPDYRRAVEERLRQMSTDGKRVPLIEEKLLRLDGSPIDVEVAAIPLSYEGKPAVQVVIRDIGERKRVEKLQEAVYKIAQAADHTRTLDELYRNIHTIISGVMPAKNFYIALYDEKKDLITFPYFVDEVDEQPTSSPAKAGRGLTEYVLRTGQALLCDLTTEADLQQRGEVELIGAPAPIWLGVPLQIDRKTIGVMTVQHYSDAKAYGERERQILEFVSSQVAKAIERKRVEANLRDKIMALQTLAEIDREVIAAAEASAVIQLVCHRAAELLHVPKALIGTIVPPEGTPLVAGHGLADPVRAGEDFERLRLAELLEAEAGTSSGTVVIDDWQSTETRLSEFRAREGIRALASQPLLAGERLGTLVVFDTRPRAWSAEDLELLSLLAGQAAIAFEKSRITTELQSSLTMTTRFYQLSGQIVAANTFEETARLVTHTLREGFAADVASIHLYDPQGRPVIQYDEGLPNIANLSGQPRPEGITRQALKSTMPIVFDKPELLHPLVRAAGIQSVIAMPLRSEAENFGVLFVDYRQPHNFTKREVQLLSLFANQTALALKRVRLLDETRRRADQLAVLNRIAGAASRTLDLDELLQIIYREVSAAVTAESFLIALYDVATDQLDHRIHIDKDLHLPPRRLPLERTPLIAHIIHNRESLLINDLEQGGNGYPSPRLAGTMRPTRSWLGVPLQAGFSVVGVICVQAYHPNAYGEEERQFLATVADQVAVAVKNAQLFEETRQRLSELEAINKISAAVRGAQTLQEMLPLLLDETLAALGTTAGQIAFHDPAMDELRVAVARGWFARIPTSSSADDGIAGQVFTTGQLYSSREFKADPATSELARAQIPPGWGGTIVPIRAGQQIIGVFCLSVPLPRVIQPNEVHLVTTIAEIAGGAFHRMRLHESLEASYLETVLALAKAMDARDSYTNGHADRLAMLAVKVAQKVGMSAEQQDALRFAARLHDIGKIGVPDSILLKPSALTSEEWAVMRRHPITGAEIIQPVRRLRAAAPIVRHHHERFDGTGYPDRLAGEEIPLGARILAVVDSYGAMIDDRVYRRGRPSAEARAELRHCAGTQFDPALVDIFLNLEI